MRSRGFDVVRERFIRSAYPAEQGYTIMEYPTGVTNGYYMVYFIYPHVAGITYDKDKNEVAVAGESDTEPTASIALYMPGELAQEAEIEWEAQGGLATKIFGEKQSVVDTLNLGLSAKTKDDVIGVATKAGELALKGASSVLHKMIRESDIASPVEKLTGQIYNNYEEQFFGGIGFRSFAFNYKFQPTSHDETNVVKEIIRTFRRNALPELSADKLTNYYPSQFEIEFVTPHINESNYGGYGGGTKKGNKSKTGSYTNPYMPRFKPLVCTGCNVTYGSGGGSFSSFKDGSPVEIDLELSFTETEKVYMDDVDKGY